MGPFQLVSKQADAHITWDRIVGSGAANSISRGEPTKQGSAGAVAIMADGEGTTSELFTGIAKSESTDTAAAAGRVLTYIPFPGIIYSGKPKVSGACNTQAEIDALVGSRVVFDLTSTTWTVDTAAADAIGNAVVMVGGQPEEDRIWFVVTHTSLNFFENN